MQNRSSRAALALAHLPRTDPAMASLALWCSIVDGEAAQTITSRDQIRIGSAFRLLPLHEQISVLGHHVLHIALRHETRMYQQQTRLGGNFDADLYNLCADAIVNDVLYSAGYALPRPAIQTDNLSTHVSDLAVHSGRQTRDVDKVFSICSQAGPATQNTLQNEMSKVAFSPDIHPNAPKDRRRLDLIWHQRLKQAQSRSGGAGRGVGNVLADLLELPVSRTLWQNHLRGLLATCLTIYPRRSFRRPRNAWIAAEAQALAEHGPSPVFEPGTYHQNRRPRIVIGIDTSGSITQKVQHNFASEVLGILQTMDAEIHVLAFDETVYHSMIVAQGAGRTALQDLRPRRDGGTSYTDFFDKADALDPAIIVVFTDMGATIVSAPRARVLWASPVPIKVPPSFGETLEIEL